MATATPLLIDTLRQAARNLENGAVYNWGNATKCNCAHLVQCLAPEIAADHLKTMRPMLDEWSEYANDYCPHSGAPADRLLDALYENGLTHEDIRQLEYLSNRKVLDALPGGVRYLEHGKQRDVALYMRTWASLLELEFKNSQPNRSAGENSAVALKGASENLPLSSCR